MPTETHTNINCIYTKENRLVLLQAPSEGNDPYNMWQGAKRLLIGTPWNLVKGATVPDSVDEQVVSGLPALKSAWGEFSGAIKEGASSPFRLIHNIRALINGVLNAGIEATGVIDPFVPKPVMKGIHDILYGTKGSLLGIFSNKRVYS